MDRTTHRRQPMAQARLEIEEDTMTRSERSAPMARLTPRTVTRRGQGQTGHEPQVGPGHALLDRAGNTGKRGRTMQAHDDITHRHEAPAPTTHRNQLMAQARIEEDTMTHSRWSAPMTRPTSRTVTRGGHRWDAIRRLGTATRIGCQVSVLALIAVISLSPTALTAQERSAPAERSTRSTEASVEASERELPSQRVPATTVDRRIDGDTETPELSDSSPERTIAVPGSRLTPTRVSAGTTAESDRPTTTTAPAATTENDLTPVNTRRGHNVDLPPRTDVPVATTNDPVTLEGTKANQPTRDVTTDTTTATAGSGVTLGSAKPNQPTRANGTVPATETTPTAGTAVQTPVPPANTAGAGEGTTPDPATEPTAPAPVDVPVSPAHEVVAADRPPALRPDTPPTPRSFLSPRPRR